jgi:hypothetical protein
LSPSLKRVFSGDDKGPARERMEQEVLCVEDVVDAEIERDLLGRDIVKLGGTTKKLSKAPNVWLRGAA